MSAETQVKFESPHHTQWADLWRSATGLNKEKQLVYVCLPALKQHELGANQCVLVRPFLSLPSRSIGFPPQLLLFSVFLNYLGKRRKQPFSSEWLLSNVPPVSQWERTCNGQEWSSRRSGCPARKCQKVQQELRQRDGVYHHARIWEHPSVSVPHWYPMWSYIMMFLGHTVSVQQQFATKVIGEKWWE